MRPWHLLLVMLPLFAFLGFRVMSLEDRIDLLKKMVEIQSRNAKDTVSAPVEDYEPEEEAGAEQPEQEQEQESLQALKARIEKIEALIESGELGGEQLANGEPRKALSDLTKKEGFEDYVRSVLRHEADRMRDEQLLAHRDILVENRTRVMADFAKQAGLTPSQESAVTAVLTDEADKMVELLKRPEVLQDLPKGLTKLVELLKQTDEQSSEILNPAQMLLYMQLRRLEQSAYMPWLPKENR